MTKEIVRKTHFSLCDSFLNCIDEREGDTVNLGGGRMGNFRSNDTLLQNRTFRHRKGGWREHTLTLSSRAIPCGSREWKEETPQRKKWREATEKRF